MKLIVKFFLLVCLCFTACELTTDTPVQEMEELPQTDTDKFMRGADLSYLNEMEDCGATYFNQQGVQNEPYSIFAGAGSDLVRVRLWHNADWTDYSDFEDVKKTILRAKALDMKVLLDFHYSDTWTDPEKQGVPAAWLPVVNNTAVLGDSVYNYTFAVLNSLNNLDLLPEYVQVGNEINLEILQAPDGDYEQINWSRNVSLLKKGLQAVKDASNQFDFDIGRFLHIAQPENAVWWFEQATQNGLTDYEWIGLSYYPKWSNISMNALPAVIKSLGDTYGKEVMVVETAYPFTFENNDSANNIMSEDAVLSEFAVSPQGQYDYMKTLEEKIVEGGGKGLIYWEPAWVSTGCSTLWGQGSHWDNATLFDHNNRALIGMGYFSGQ